MQGVASGNGMKTRRKQKGIVKWCRRFGDASLPQEEAAPRSAFSLQAIL
jgi:hypothetical protein